MGLLLPIYCEHESVTVSPRKTTSKLYFLVLLHHPLALYMLTNATLLRQLSPH